MYACLCACGLACICACWYVVSLRACVPAPLRVHVSSLQCPGFDSCYAWMSVRVHAYVCARVLVRVCVCGYNVMRCVLVFGVV